MYRKFIGELLQLLVAVTKCIRRHYRTSSLVSARHEVGRHLIWSLSHVDPALVAQATRKQGTHTKCGPFCTNALPWVRPRMPVYFATRGIHGIIRTMLAVVLDTRSQGPEYINTSSHHRSAARNCVTPLQLRRLGHRQRIAHIICGKFVSGCVETTATYEKVDYNTWEERSAPGFLSQAS